MSEALLGGRYEILDRLGVGGMGTVYRGRDTRLLREVAIKVLSVGEEESEDDLLCFHREARAVAALQHPNIVQIFDYSGPAETPPYIVIELVDGGDLIQMVEQRAAPPDAVIASIAASVAAGLSHAHENGVIHRDVKPANIMLTSSGRVLLTDFGLAKAYDDPSRLGGTVADRVTTLFGTPSFVAPEQVEEESSSPDSDVFSFGSVVYFLATGASPFYEADPVVAMRRILNVDYRPLEEARPDLAADLSALVAACLKREPVDRPTAAELEDEYRGWLAQRGLPNPDANVEAYLHGEAVEGERADTTLVVSERPEPPAVSARPAQRVAADPASAETEVRTHVAAWGQPAAGHPKETPMAVRAAPVPAPAVAASSSSRAVSVLIGVLALVMVGAAGTTFVLLNAGAGEQQQAKVEVIPISPTEPPTPPQAIVPPPAEPVVTATPPSEPEPATEAPAPVSAHAASSPDVVDEVGDEPRAKRRRRGKPKRAADGVVSVKIIVEPWGTVFLDGKKIGNTPLVHEIRAPVGAHRIAVEHPSKGRVEQIVQFGRQKKVYFDLGD